MKTLFRDGTNKLVDIDMFLDNIEESQSLIDDEIEGLDNTSELV